MLQARAALPSHHDGLFNCELEGPFTPHLLLQGKVTAAFYGPRLHHHCKAAA